MIRPLPASLVFLSLFACGHDGPEFTRINARFAEPSIDVSPGEHELNLGGNYLVNGLIEWKDGYLFVPSAAANEDDTPLLIWLHGGGGDAESTRYMFEVAEEYGVAVLTLDARHNTWDGIDSPYIRDVPFINEALTYTFQRIKVDQSRIALGGLSDGGAYALAIGRTNGDFFSHLIAVAPGPLTPPGPPVGSPRVLVMHGARDNVYPTMLSRRLIVPGLESEGYNVTYIEFDGPHWATEAAMHEILRWFTST